MRVLVSSTTCSFLVKNVYKFKFSLLQSGVSVVRGFKGIWGMRFQRVSGVRGFKGYLG